MNEPRANNNNFLTFLVFLKADMTAAIIKIIAATTLIKPKYINIAFPPSR